MAFAAQGYVFSPAGTAFAGNGTLTISASPEVLTCSAAMTGDTTGPAQIIGMSFSGAPDCSSLTATTLPWRFVAQIEARAQINHVTLSFPGFGRCGTNQADTTISGGTIAIQDKLPSKQGKSHLHDIAGDQHRPPAPKNASTTP